MITFYSVESLLNYSLYKQSNLVFTVYRFQYVSAYSKVQLHPTLKSKYNEEGRHTGFKEGR
jgi:hypothetical protein